MTGDINAGLRSMCQEARSCVDCGIITRDCSVTRQDFIYDAYIYLTTTLFGISGEVISH